jgi:hypothetical protein
MVESSLDYYTTNAIDQVAMINTLRLLGNRRAEVVVTMGRWDAPIGRISAEWRAALLFDRRRGGSGCMDPRRAG